MRTNQDQGETHLKRTGSRTFYERIHEGGMAYLDRDSVASFHELFPMSLKGRNVVFAHLEAIKVVAQDMIEVSGWQGSKAIEVLAHLMSSPYSVTKAISTRRSLKSTGSLV